MSRISALPSVGMSHREVGTPPSGGKTSHLTRRLRPYQVTGELVELAHCPRCGADAGVFRRLPGGLLVCRDCAE